MELLGVGPLEFILIIIIAIIIIGPKDMAKTGRVLGQLLRKIVTSQWWSGFRHASREISQLPYTLMREASIEEATKSLDELEALGNDIARTNPPDARPGFQSWTNSIFPAQKPNGNPTPKNTETIQENTQNPPVSG